MSSQLIAVCVHPSIKVVDISTFSSRISLELVSAADIVYACLDFLNIKQEHRSFKSHQKNDFKKDETPIIGFGI
jgi:hypothetical protein